jgi:hypothetical protein
MAPIAQQPPRAISAMPWRQSALLIAIALAAACVLLAGRGPLRSVAAVLVVLGPGLGLAPLLDIRDRAVAALLVIVISVTCLICVAQAVTYITFFAWRPCALILVIITAGGTVAQILRRRAGRSS